MQGHHAQSINDIPVGMYNQSDGSQSGYQAQHHQQQYYSSYQQNQSPQNHEDMTLPSYYGTAQPSEKRNSASSVSKQKLNGPKENTAPPAKRKRGRPALFPQADGRSNLLLYAHHFAHSLACTSYILF